MKSIIALVMLAFATVSFAQTNTAAPTQAASAAKKEEAKPAAKKEEAKPAANKSK